MSFSIPWIPAVILGCTGGSLYVMYRMWALRERPGARYWIGFIGAIALWTFSYGLALLVFNPALRKFFEIGIWVGKNAVPPTMLGAALAFTGRKHLAYSKAMAVNLIFWLGAALTYSTNPIHGLTWTNYHITPVFGLATVTYHRGLLLYFFYAIAYIEIGAAILFLTETFFRHGTASRLQVFSVGSGILVPTVASAVWLLQLGPLPALNLAPIAFVYTIAVTSFVLFQRDLFEISPSTRWVANQAALDDIGSAVIFITPDRQIVDLNTVAEELFEISESDVIGEPVSTLLPIDEDESLTDGMITEISMQGRRRIFKLSKSDLIHPSEDYVGATLVFQDITRERLREERVTVLNRLLRHNLRNDMMVARGYVDASLDEVDEHVHGMLTTAKEEMTNLVRLGEKARSINLSLDEDRTEIVSLREVIEQACMGIEADRSAIEIDVPESCQIKADRELLSVLFANAIENGIEHGGSDSSVKVTLTDQDDAAQTVTLTVSDDGPGIPEQEVAVLERGDEDDLEHGSSIGLWLIKWSINSLGGDIDIESERRSETVTGTNIRVKLPQKCV